MAKKTIKTESTTEKTIKPKVIIAMACFGEYLKSKTAFSLLQAVKGDFDYEFIMRIGSDIASLRNGLVQEAKRIGGTHILFVDYDMFFPEKGTIQKLLDFNKDIVGVAYNKRKLPPESTAVPILAIEGPLFKCNAIGAGLFLIKLSVFDSVPEPWFLFGYNKDGSMRFGEDTYFCQQAIKAGFDVWGTLEVHCKHLGEYQY